MEQYIQGPQMFGKWVQTKNEQWLRRVKEHEKMQCTHTGVCNINIMLYMFEIISN